MQHIWNSSCCPLAQPNFNTFRSMKADSIAFLLVCAARSWHELDKHLWLCCPLPYSNPTWQPCSPSDRGNTAHNQIGHNRHGICSTLIRHCTVRTSRHRPTPMLDCYRLSSFIYSSWSFSVSRRLHLTVRSHPSLRLLASHVFSTSVVLCCFLFPLSPATSLPTVILTFLDL